MEQNPPEQVETPSADVWNSIQAEESLGTRGGSSEPLGRAAMEACMCNLREVASREGLLEEDEDRPVITRARNLMYLRSLSNGCVQILAVAET